MKGLVETLIWEKQDNAQRGNFAERVEAICQTLTQTGLSHIGHWNCKVD